MPLTRFTLRQLEAFACVAELHSFTAAAERLGLTAQAWAQAPLDPNLAPNDFVQIITDQALKAIEANDAIRAGDAEAIKQAAASGLGLSCLSLCAVQDMLALGRLVVLPTTLPPLTRRFTLISHKAKSWSGAMRAFLEQV